MKSNGTYELSSGTSNPGYHKSVDSVESGNVETENGYISENNEEVESDPDQPQQKEPTEEEEEEDPWAVSTLVIKSTPWKELSVAGKVERVLWNYIFRQIAFLLLLYLFICSLDFLSSAFRLLGGKAAGQVFANNEIITNPVAGLMIGVLCTVLVQSSSTSTSIIVSMVGVGLIDKVRYAIPMIMGANIGTSVTNTIVALSQMADKNQFRRAFGGATVHDMFNWLTVIVLLPLEAIAHPLERLSLEIVKPLNISTARNEDANPKLLKAITAPFTKYIISIDKDAIKKIAHGEAENVTTLIQMKGDYMFMKVAGKWDDWVIGLIMLFISLVLLCSSLIFIVKILNSVFSGSIAKVLKKFVNADFPGYGKYFTGYVAILIGAGFTLLVQSSSIFTSALTPLVGVGVLTLDRMYPLTLGSNIGTTFTAILASLAQNAAKFQNSFQIAMCHLFFNIFGIIIWYPVPFMRKVPITLARKLGNTTAEHRWFAILYLIVIFFLFPALVFGLSLAHWGILVGIGIPFIILIIFIVVVIILQTKKPQVLVPVLRSWNFLPRPLRSWRPLENLFKRCCRCCPQRCNCSTAEKE